MTAPLPRPSQAYNQQDQATARQGIEQALARKIGRPTTPHDPVTLQGDELFPYLGGNGREGSATPLEVIDVPYKLGTSPDTFARSNRSRWLRVLNVEDYCVPFDVTQDVNNSNALMAAMADRLPFGGDVVFPHGWTVYFAPDLINMPDSVNWVGEGGTTCALGFTGTTGVCVRTGVANRFERIKLFSPSYRTAGYMIYSEHNAAQVLDCEFDHYYWALGFEETAYGLVVLPEVVRCKFRDPSITPGGGIALFNGISNGRFTDNVGSGPASGTQPTYGLRFVSGDTFFSSNNNITLHGVSGIDAQPNKSTFGFKSVDDFWDSAENDSFQIVATTSGLVSDTTLTGMWCGLAKTGNGCLVDYVGPAPGAGNFGVKGVKFVNCEFPDNASAGFVANDPNVTGLVMSNCSAGGNGLHDFYFKGGIGGFHAMQLVAQDLGRGRSAGIGLFVEDVTSAGYTYDLCAMDAVTAGYTDNGTPARALLGNI